MATDIAFALGIILLLGNGIPIALKLFLVTLAVVDDLGAVIVIALFYTDSLNLMGVFISVTAFTFMILLNRQGIKALLPYILLGFILWLVFISLVYMLLLQVYYSHLSFLSNPL